jgi:ABC-type branched-subunit amino acid transport system substrate-binding protein
VKAVRVLVPIVGALSLLAAACGSRDESTAPSTSTATTAGNTVKATKASDIGITPTEIRIAVLADVDNPVIPGLFEGSKDAVMAFADHVNENGGLAGRKLVVDFIDTGLNPEKVKTAMQESCTKDFALVGTSLALSQTVDPIVDCKDLAGATTGIPDFAALSIDPSQQASPVTFSALPPQRDYAVKDHQQFNAQTGQYSFYKKELGVTHGFYLNSADSQTSKDANSPRFYAAQNIIGIKADTGTQFVSQFATQADYAPFVQAMAKAGSEFAESGGPYQGLVKWRKAAAQQGLDTVKVWSCVLACYDPGFLQTPADVEDTYVSVPFLPFLDPEEQDAVPAVKTFVDAVGADKANGFAIQAWTSALLFEQAVEQVVAKDGVDGLTRAAVLEQVATIHDFDADGLMGPTDVGRRIPSPCIVNVQVQGDAFVRVAPTKVGEMDCTKSNITVVDENLWPE